MKSLFGIALSLLVLCSSQGRAQEKDPPITARLALVSNEKNEGVRTLLTLAEAKLGELSHIKLLERQAIDKVIAEQKLSLSGAVAADSVLTVGKLLAVDVFALLEAGQNEKEAAGLVIFDARTGARLWDAALPTGEVDNAVTATVNAVRAALRKRNDKTRSLCVMTVRNADLPRDLDSFCDSVGLLLERQLAASSDLAVLERSRLEQVNRERDLPADSPLHQLLASVVTLELEVGATESRKGGRVTVLLSDGKGKSLGKATVEVEKRDAVELAERAYKELAKVLKTNGDAAVGDRNIEAIRFYREAVYCLAHQEQARAVRAAESALALRPDEAFLHATLTRCLLAQSAGLLTPTGKDPRTGRQTPNRINADVFAQSLALARRGSEMLIAVEKVVPEARNANAWVHFRMQAGAPMTNYRTRISQLRQTLSAEERDTFAVVRTNLNKAHELRAERARKAIADVASFDEYTRIVDRAVTANSLDRFLPDTEWIEQLLQLRNWAQSAGQFAEEGSGMIQSLLWSAVESYAMPRRIVAGEAARLQTLWDELAKHPNGTISLYGTMGGVVNSAVHVQSAPAEVRRQLREFRLGLQAMLEKSQGISPGLRRSFYHAGEHLFTPHGTRLRLAGQREEFRELADFMVRRKEIVPGIVNQLGLASLSATEEDRRHAYAVIQKTLDLLAAGEGRLIVSTNPVIARVEEESFRSQAFTLQGIIRRASPGVVPPAATPWEKVTTLLDVQANTQGVLWLQQPVVHEGSIYVAAIRREGLTARFSAQLLRLTPGKGDPWEGKPLALALRPKGGSGPLVGPNRHGLHFATTACVYQGRYYLGTEEDGILVFPFDGGTPERLGTSDGLPSQCVQKLLGFENKLYACLGDRNKEFYLVSRELKSGQLEMLASSRRKEKRSPFDDAPPVQAVEMLADVARGRLLLLTFPSSDYLAVSGLWAFAPKGAAWKRLLTLHGVDSLLCEGNSRIEGDRLVLGGGLGELTYDLNDKDTRLHFNGKVKLETEGKFLCLQLEALKGFRSRREDVRPPYVLVDDWVWGTFPFARWRYDSPKTEQLATLRPGAQFFLLKNLQRFSERELLVGDDFGLWLIKTRKDAAR